MKIRRRLSQWLYTLCYLPHLCFAGNSDSPFPKIDIGNGDVITAVGSHMEAGMKYAMIGGGVIMMLVGIGVIMHRLREDSTNKDSGNFIMTLILAGVAITVGIILITIGWAAANYTPTTNP